MKFQHIEEMGSRWVFSFCLRNGFQVVEYNKKKREVIVLGRKKLEYDMRNKFMELGTIANIKMDPEKALLPPKFADSPLNLGNHYIPDYHPNNAKSLFDMSKDKLVRELVSLRDIKENFDNKVQEAIREFKEETQDQLEMKDNIIRRLKEDYENAVNQGQIMDNEIIEKQGELEKTIEECNCRVEQIRKECNDRIEQIKKDREDDCNNKIQEKENDCDKEIRQISEKKKKECDFIIKLKEQKCNHIIKQKEDECNLEQKNEKDNEITQIKEDYNNRIKKQYQILIGAFFGFVGELLPQIRV
eukprot:TRINITY_DN4708_c0_g1_i2.p1 TRINITY_DN4708_c0_g1~~TRINITY_DN4708_c0_g1_i2.p1  ORF type:complete len:301 (-),score=54.79 TRINITY_DN4708_c0_g1_i2:112-1014(-)